MYLAMACSSAFDPFVVVQFVSWSNLSLVCLCFITIPLSTWYAFPFSFAVLQVLQAFSCTLALMAPLLLEERVWTVLSLRRTTAK